MANEVEILVVDDDNAAAQSFAELISSKLKLRPLQVLTPMKYCQ